ncbi:response regulator [Gilvimarinus polysaccharolyticus]|uniref:response regulator n=1 Tax=Gilvimarinus polysaccharolyticus TaxID=863921 RepID=UPI0006733A85|nr:response regulator [Gilvimarinus polysaccharolyticus]
MRILLVEDDELLAEGIMTALRHFQYNVDWLSTGAAAVKMLKRADHALLILDLGLPDMDGLQVLKQARESKFDLPVLVLTARDQIDEKIAGLNAGADDYMVKPFDINELEARIRSLTRRANGRRTDLLEVGRASLNLNERVMLFNDTSITFSRREFSLVQAFFERPRQVFTREVLESLSYSWDEEIDSNSLEVHIHRLRKKLGNNGIKTVRGVGYMLVEEHFS